MNESIGVKHCLRLKWINKLTRNLKQIDVTRKQLRSESIYEWNDYNVNEESWENKTVKKLFNNISRRHANVTGYQKGVFREISRQVKRQEQNSVWSRK